MNILLSRLLMAVCAVMALLAGWQWSRADRAEAALETYKAQVALQLADAATAARTEERRRSKTIQEALDAEVLARQAVEADARGAADAAGRLRQRAAQLAAACTARDPAAPSGSAPAPAAAAVLADLLGRVAAAAGELGSYADRARVAGETCERSYDALRPSR